MRKFPYKLKTLVPLLALVLVSCGQSNQPTESTESSTSANVEQPQESNKTSSQKSDSSSSETSTEKTSLTEQLKMNNALIRLPQQLLDEETAEITGNTTDSYDVSYENNLAHVSGKIYADSDTALKAVEDKMEEHGVQVDPVEGMGVDLDNGITGYPQGAAGNQYFSWSEGNWDITIHSLSVDELDNQNIAQQMVDYLEEHSLPAPSEQGMILVDYPQGGETVEVNMVWQEDNVVYALTTSQVPVDALAVAASMDE